MTEIIHWFAALVVLSVALARLEAIHISRTVTMDTLARAVGWMLLGIDGFCGLLEPFIAHHWWTTERLGLVGMALLAVAYKWVGKNSYHGEKRRASDH